MSDFPEVDVGVLHLPDDVVDALEVLEVDGQGFDARVRLKWKT